MDRIHELHLRESEVTRPARPNGKFRTDRLRSTHLTPSESGHCVSQRHRHFGALTATREGL